MRGAIAEVETSGLALTVIPYGSLHGGTASSDVGEASAVVPLAELAVATRPQGTPAHHWAQTSCAGTDVGRKGMHVAARVLARSLEALLASPAKVAEARAEWTKATKGRPYVSPLAEGAKPARW